MLDQTKGLADQAPQAIALHRVAGRLHGDGKADAGKSKTIGPHAQPEEAIVDTLARRIEGIELQLAAQAQFGAEA